MMNVTGDYLAVLGIAVRGSAPVLPVKLDARIEAPADLLGERHGWFCFSKRSRASLCESGRVVLDRFGLQRMILLRHQIAGVFHEAGCSLPSRVNG